MLPSTFLWCFSLSQIGDSCKHLQGPISTWKDQSRIIGILQEEEYSCSGSSKCLYESPICDKLKYQKRCLEAFFVLRVQFVGWIWRKAFSKQRRSKHHKCPKSSTMLLFFMSDLTCLTKPGQMWWSPAHFTTVMNFYWQGPKRPNGHTSPKSLTNNGETCRVCVEDSQMWNWTKDPNDTLMTCARWDKSL